MKFIQTDGGRGPDFSGEKNDCTVRAFALATEIPYKQAHALMTSLGRKPKRRVYFEKMMLQIEGQCFNGYMLVRRGVVYKTVAKFVEAKTEGRYLVRIRGHVTAVINGVLMDIGQIPPRCRITNVWELVAP